MLQKWVAGMAILVALVALIPVELTVNVLKGEFGLPIVVVFGILMVFIMVGGWMGRGQNTSTGEGEGFTGPDWHDGDSGTLD